MGESNTIDSDDHRLERSLSMVFLADVTMPHDEGLLKPKPRNVGSVSITDVSDATSTVMIPIVLSRND